MSASAVPPSRPRCRETPERSAQDPIPSATPLFPFVPPRLHGEAAPFILGYCSARRPASTTAEIDRNVEYRVTSPGNVLPASHGAIRCLHYGWGTLGRRQQKSPAPITIPFSSGLSERR